MSANGAEAVERARPPFPFIVGCGRSGTTLLRAMCDAHPDLTVAPESHFVVALAPPGGARRQPFDAGAFVEQLCATEQFAMWGFDHDAVMSSVAAAPPDNYPDAVRRVFELWARREGKPRYADKTPVYVLHVGTLARLFPEAVFVHLVRDGRDVASSFIELGWTDTIEQAALHWRLRVRAGRQAGLALAPGRYHEVRYEDLLADPERELRAVCDVIGVPFVAAMLDHTAGAEAVARTTRHPEYHRRLAGPASPGLRDWRRELSADDVARFELLAGGTLRAFGYERSGRRPSMTVGARVAGRWVRWQLHRVRRRLTIS